MIICDKILEKNSNFASFFEIVINLNIKTNEEVQL